MIDKRIEQRVSSVRVSIRLRASEYDVVFERYRSNYTHDYPDDSKVKALNNITFTFSVYN